MSQYIKNQTVSPLMVVGRREWDNDIIGDIFNEIDRITISNTRLEEEETHDVI